MKRDIFKCSDLGIDKLSKNQFYGLSLDEVEKITEKYNQRAQETTPRNALLELITTTYAAGFENGTRYTRNTAKN